MAYTIAAKTFTAYKSTIGTVGAEAVEWILENCPSLSLDSNTGTASTTAYNAYLKYKDYPMGMRISFSSHTYCYPYAIKSDGTYGYPVSYSSSASYSKLFYFTGENVNSTTSFTLKILSVDDSVVCITMYTGTSMADAYYWKFSEMENIVTGDIHGCINCYCVNYSYATTSIEAYKSNKGYVYMPDEALWYSISEYGEYTYLRGKLGDASENPDLCIVMDPLYYCTGGIFKSAGLLEKTIVLNSGAYISTITDIPVQIGDHKYLFSYGSSGYGAVMVE